MLDLVSLQRALLVLQYGSFRKAAEALSVRPSVISRHVRALEDTIGVSLFQRQSNGVQPTLAGRKILSRGRSILSDVDSLLRTATLSGSGAEGRLCIGVGASIAGGTARELLREFLSSNPAVELDVVEGTPAENLAWLRALRMDVVLIVGAGSIIGLEVEPLWSEQMHVALPCDHPAASFEAVSWDQLASERFIVTKMDPGPEIRDSVVRHLVGLGRRPIVEPRAVLREGLLALVGLGFGISLVGTAETAVSYPDVVFRPLAGEMLPFSTVWAANNDNPVLRRFLSLARAHVRRERPAMSAEVLGGELL